MSNESEAIRLFDSSLMKLDEIASPGDLSQNGKYVKISEGTAGQVSGLTQFIPAAITGKALSGAYRVEFPAGIHGELTPHNGGFLATIRDVDSKQFKGNGTLFSLKDMAAATQVFALLSTVTNQYYIHQINHQLTDIQTRLDQVLEFLYDDKACAIYAEAQTAFAIYRNYASIMTCPEQRTASLQTLQRSRILAEHNIQFYYRDMNKLARGGDNYSRIRNDLHNYTQAIYLYGVCAVMEIVLSGNYDKAYLTDVEEDLRAHTNQHNQNVAKLHGMISGSHATRFELRLPKAGGDPAKENLLADIQRILDEPSPVKGFEDMIARIRATYSGPIEYMVLQDGSVYQRKLS